LVADPAGSHPDAVVLIHGLWMHGLTMEPMRWRLAAHFGFAVHSYTYPSVAEGLAANVRRLSAYLASLPARRLHLVGHSLGGILALRTLAGLPDAPPGRVVCLGTPLSGSSAAQALRRWRAGEAMLGKMIRDTVIDAPLTAYDGDRDVGVIAGDSGFGIGLLLNAVAAGALASPHDGTVTVAETRLPGIRDHLVLPVTHTWMLLSREVADQTAHFLRHGEFAREGQSRDRAPGGTGPATAERTGGSRRS
jgi:pimeloyl-ACP methyl ester carboxylesterase